MVKSDVEFIDLDEVNRKVTILFRKQVKTVLTLFKDNDGKRFVKLLNKRYYYQDVRRAAGLTHILYKPKYRGVKI